MRVAFGRGAPGRRSARVRCGRGAAGRHLARVAFDRREARRRLALADSGQAAAEFVVLLPVVAVVLAVAFQALLAGQAAWEARVAARAAARAHAFGDDATAAARGHLRDRLERGLQVKARAGGDVRVSIRIPTVLPALELGRASATSHFRPQGG